MLYDKIEKDYFFISNYSGLFMKTFLGGINLMHPWQHSEFNEIKYFNMDVRS